MAQSSNAKRSLGQRLTGKVGPLPAWAWAALILGAFLLYTRLHSSSSSSGDATAPASTSSSDQTPVTGDTSGSPPASGGGDPASNVNDGLLSQLSGFGSSIDALTAAVQSSPAFVDGSNSGGANYGGGPIISLPNMPAPAVGSAVAAKPTPKIASPSAPVKYYTYAPGKAPKGQAKNTAPAKAPAGKTLHFTKGKGYYYA